MKIFLLFALLLINFSQTTKAENSTNSNLEVLNIISDICYSPSTEGKYWKLDTSGNAGARISIFGEIEGNVDLTQEEWNGIRNLKSEDQVSRENSYRSCVQYMMPIVLERMVKPDKIATGPRGCTQDQYDQVQNFAYLFAQKHINKSYEGGQDIISNVNSCNYNSYSKQYQADLSVSWNGIFFRSNHYELSGKISINTNGQYSFSRGYANSKLEEYETMKNILIFAVVTGSLLEESKNH